MTRLSSMLSEKSGRQKKKCEEFLKEFFRIISSELERGESVRIKGFGTFKISDIEPRKSVSVASGEEVEIPGHKRVLFVPSKELAAIVNAPFAMFEANEVDDDISTDLLMTIDQEELENPFSEDTVDTTAEEETSEAEVSSDTVEELQTVESPALSDMSEFSESSDFDSDFFSDQPEEFENSDSSEYSIEESITYESPDQDGYIVGDSHIYDEEETRDYFPDDSIETEAAEDALWSGEDSSAFSMAGKKKFFSFPSFPKREKRMEREKPSYDSRDRRCGGHRFLWGFITGILTIVIIGGALFYFFGLKPLEDEFYRQGVEDAMLELSGGGIMESEEFTEEETPSLVEANETAQTSAPSQTPAASTSPGQPAATVETPPAQQNSASQASASDAVPTRPSDAPIYDNVSTTRYLTTMAREYYGNMDLWPIIYEENKSRLGHPDKIKPGTRVVIPPLRKYHVDPKNPNDVKRIKAKGEEIYRRYRVVNN